MSESKSSMIESLKTSKLSYTSDYTSGKMIGEGATSIVRYCQRKKDHKEFAVKIIDKKALEKENCANIKREIAILNELKNTHGAIQLIEVYENKRNIHIVLELCKGGTLFSLISHKRSQNKTIKEKHVCHIFYQLCKTVHECHKKGIIHRDLKPENLFLKYKNKPILKLSDFGLSYIIDKKNKKMKTRCGSPHYVAPEVILGNYEGGSCDWWSCGVILYALLSGCLPFWDDNHQKLYRQILKADYSFPSNQWKNVSEDAKDLVSKLLVVDPEQRWNYSQVLQHPFMTKHLSKNV